MTTLRYIMLLVIIFDLVFPFIVYRKTGEKLIFVPCFLLGVAMALTLV